MDKQIIENFLMDFPVFEYSFIDVSKIVFSPRVRHICETECERYATSWACPPAVGTLEECESICFNYQNALLLSTIAEVKDIIFLEEVFKTRQEHEDITRQVQDRFTENNTKTLVLSTESCAVCGKCTYPDGPCRHPDILYPCIESYGILVTDLAEQSNMTFYNASNIVTWFSLIFF